jgi:ATP synthase protein I
MPKPESPMRTLGTVGSVGFAFVIAIALGWWLGSTLDRWMGTSPWFTFIFFVFGVIAGSLNVFRAFSATQTGMRGDGGGD